MRQRLTICLLFLTAALAACAGPVEPARAPAPTAVPAATTAAVPTMTPPVQRSPVPRLKVTGQVPAADKDLLGRSYNTLTYVEGVAVMVDEVARQAQAAGLAMPPTGDAFLITQALAATVSEGLARIPPAAPLAGLWGDAGEVHAQTVETLRAWQGGEIAPAEVLRRLGPVQARSAAIATRAEEVLEAEYGYQAAELRQMRESSLATLRAMLGPK
jgi:hypothetical protein